MEAGARLRSIIEEDVAGLLEVLAPDDEPDTDKFRDLVSRVEEGVQKEEFDALRKCLGQAESIVYILALMSYARATGVRYNAMDEHPESRFANRLQASISDATGLLGGFAGSDEVKPERRSNFCVTSKDRFTPSPLP